jgi:hypothetical protein
LTLSSVFSFDALAEVHRLTDRTQTSGAEPSAFRSMPQLKHQS